MSIQGQHHSLTLAQGHSDMKIKTRFSQKPLGHFEPNFIGKPLWKHAYSNILKNLIPKKWNFSDKNSDIFDISAQNIDCGYSLELLGFTGVYIIFLKLSEAVLTIPTIYVFEQK